MRKLFTLAVCALLLSATNFLAGCTTSQKSAAYRTLKTVADSVDAAMTAAAEAKVLGIVSDEDWTKIRVLHDRYRVTFKQAVIAAKFDYASAAPAEVAGLAAELAALVATFAHRVP